MWRKAAFKKFTLLINSHGDVRCSQFSVQTRGYVQWQLCQEMMHSSLLTVAATAVYLLLPQLQELYQNMMSENLGGHVSSVPDHAQAV